MMAGSEMMRICEEIDHQFSSLSVIAAFLLPPPPPPLPGPEAAAAAAGHGMLGQVHRAVSCSCWQKLHPCIMMLMMIMLLLQPTRGELYHDNDDDDDDDDAEGCR